MNQKKLLFWGVLITGLIFSGLAAAQNMTADIPADLRPLAQELGCSSKEACRAVFDADLQKGIELAQKYEIYDEKQTQLAQSYKKEVLEKLASVSDEEFDQKIIELASNLIKSKPTLAKQFGVEKKEVDAARVIVSEVRDAGVNINVCSQSVESLSREELIACLNAAQNLKKQESVVKVYVSEERLARAETANGVFGLEEALKKGEYRNLGLTADEIGLKCLKPGSLAICDEIAKRFFGEAGVQELKSAREQISGIEDYFKQSAQKFALVTPEGRTLTGKEAIKSSCDRAFEERNVSLARACGDFAVKNGFVSARDFERGIKLLESTRDTSIDFGACRRNPQACEQFLPAEARGQISVMRQVEEIMRAEIGFDPRECERGEFDENIGLKCFEGSKRALPKLEAIASQSPQVQWIVSDIKQHLKEGEIMMQKKDEFRETFKQGSGPGGCKSEAECRTYCSDPTHGPECIAFGAKVGVFQGGEAVERYQKFNQKIISGQQYPSFGQTGVGSTVAPQQLGVYPPGGYPSAGGGFGFGPGPSPECFAAIQSGDFAKAKQVCFAPPTGYYPPPREGPCPQSFAHDMGGYCMLNQDTSRCVEYPNAASEGNYNNQVCAAHGQYTPPPQECPPVIQVLPQSCPSGQYRQERRDERGCFIGYGDCVSGQPPICPSLPTVTSCPAGQNRVVSWSSPECGTYYTCVSGTQPPQCPSGQYWNGSQCVSSSPAGNCLSYTSQSTCSASGCIWYQNHYDGTHCDDAAHGQGAQGTCPSNFAHDMGGYCMLNNDTSKCAEYPSAGSETNYNNQVCQTWQQQQTCPSGQYWNGTACVSGGSGNWVNHVWQFTDGTEQSYILNRTDSEYQNYIASIDAQCRQISRSRFAWRSGAGDSSASNWQNFGIPDCSGNAQGQCSQGQYWYVPPGGGSGYCTSGGGSSSGCFYTNVQRNGQYIGYSVHCTVSGTDCRRETADGSLIDMTGVTLGTERNCYGQDGGGDSCTQELISLLDTGCHNMGNAWFNGEMTRYVLPNTNTVRNCASEYLAGCTGGGGGNCSSITSEASCSSSGCQWNVPPAGGGSSYCSTIYAGGPDSCPGFSYSRWANNARYCELNNFRSCQTNYPAYLNISNYSPSNCPSDNAVCGNNVCDSGETSGSCPADCGGGGGGSCTAELISLLGSGCHNMGNAWFNGEMTRYVYPNTTTVKECTTEYTSGCTGGGGGGSCNYNGTCDGTESYQTCPSDCGGGGGGGFTCNSNGTCDANENYQSCPSDCGGGGGYACNNNGVCDGSETYQSCPSDCSGGGGYTCNTNGICEGNETYQSCPSDCGGGGGGGGAVCGNGNCEGTETQQSCPADCGQPPPQCPEGQYWDGNACVPQGGGAYNRTAHFYAQLVTSLKRVTDFFWRLFR